MRRACLGFASSPTRAVARLYDPLRIRTRGVAIAVATTAANGVQIAEEILADARGLFGRIESALDI